MFRWAIVFFIVAIVAAIFGFGNISAAATDIAKVLFFLAKNKESFTSCTISAKLKSSF